MPIAGTNTARLLYDYTRGRKLIKTHLSCAIAVHTMRLCRYIQNNLNLLYSAQYHLRIYGEHSLQLNGFLQYVLMALLWQRPGPGISIVFSWLAIAPHFACVQGKWHFSPRKEPKPFRHRTEVEYTTASRKAEQFVKINRTAMVDKIALEPLCFSASTRP